VSITVPLIVGQLPESWHLRSTKAPRRWEFNTLLAGYENASVLL
jgi:hypothetical protein